MSAFNWATVTQITPLRVQLDGDAAALVVTPDSLVDPRLFSVGTRVRVELANNRIIVHGAAGGDKMTDLVTEDLDTVLRAGVYRQVSSGAATALRHYPVTRGGLLLVEEALSAPGTEFYATQTYYTRDGVEADNTVRRIFVRNYRNGTWSAWRSLLTSEDFHLAVYGIPGTVTPAGAGSSASLNDYGVVTFAACTSLIVDGCIEDGYDYEIFLHNNSGTGNNNQFIFRSTAPADLATANYQRHAGPLGAGGAGATDLAPNVNQSNWTWNAATTNRHQVRLYLFNPRNATAKIGHIMAFGDTDSTAWAAGGSLSNVLMNVRYSAATVVAGFKITFSSAQAGTVTIRRHRVA